MRLLELWFALILPAALVTARPRTCTRSVTSTPDCSTTNGECNAFYDSDDPALFVSQLPFPQANTRVCYRTCFEDETCKAFAAHSSPQPLPLVNGSEFNFRTVFSPRDRKGFYRKSTNCRYSVECELGQIISFSAIDFRLEGRANCDNEQKCVDWVEITFYDVNERKRFCGTEQHGRVVGHNKIKFEFSSNRLNQATGFKYFVYCLDDDSVQNMATAQSCSKPFGSKPPIIQPKRLAYNPTTDCHRIVVRRKWTILFRDNTVAVINADHHAVIKYQGIHRLDVENPISRRIKMYHPSPKTNAFRGFGVLAVHQGRAYYFQTGVNPTLQPSREESQAIQIIDRALNMFLKVDTFDVKDDLDDKETRFPQSQRRHFWAYRKQTLYSSRRNYVSSLAALYGNACNPALRAAACNYQAIVERKDCKTGLAL